MENDYQPRFVLDKKLKNVTVEILYDKMLDDYSIGWEYQDNTEDITYEVNNNGRMECL